MAWKLPNFALISPNEKELINLIEESNPDEDAVWKVPNLLIPLATIVLALISNLLFGAKRWELMSYINLIVNGSLPLIAINQISGLGIQIFDFDKSKEEKYQIGSTKPLRVKLFYYCIAIFVIGVLLFAHQVITNPFDEIIQPLLLLFLSALLVKKSSSVSKQIFFLQDNLMSKTFDQTIVNDMKKKHAKHWQ